MRISVALCTYNGERFLGEQLESIAAQSILPDEIVVCDDCSNDKTVSIIQDYSARSSIPVRCVRNEENLRSTANFAKAIGLCQGEFIVLCDQDDVWYPQKLERLVKELEQDSEAGFVFSNADLVDPTLQPLNLTAWESIQFIPRKQQLVAGGEAHRVFLSQYVATGATMMFRSKFRPLILPIPQDWVHDAWIAFLLAAVAPVRFVSEPLLAYRQHPGQQIGLPRARRGLIEMYRTAKRMQKVSFSNLHEQFHQSYARLSEYPKCDPRFLQGLERKLEHLDRRAKLRDRGRIGRLPAVASETTRGNYGRYSYGWKSVLQDLFF